MKKKVFLIIALCCFICSNVYAIDINDKVSCGNIGSFHRKIPELTNWFFIILEIVVPVILVILGVIDFAKSITGQKEDEIKKGQNIFIKRLITAVLIFFVVAIVKFVIGLVSVPGESNGIFECIDCFMNNRCG